MYITQRQKGTFWQPMEDSGTEQRSRSAVVHVIAIVIDAKAHFYAFPYRDHPIFCSAHCVHCDLIRNLTKF